jgi:exodeoxyribonuclease VII small subunit
MDRAAEAPEEPSFETALARLAEIVEALEKGDLPLERSLALFEEGVRLSRLGAERLENAELRVEQLLASSTTKPLALDDKSVKESPRPAGKDPR